MLLPVLLAGPPCCISTSVSRGRIESAWRAAIAAGPRFTPTPVLSAPRPTPPSPPLRFVGCPSILTPNSFRDRKIGRRIRLWGRRQGTRNVSAKPQSHCRTTDTLSGKCMVSPAIEMNTMNLSLAEAGSLRVSGSHRTQP